MTETASESASVHPVTTGARMGEGPQSKRVTSPRSVCHVYWTQKRQPSQVRGWEPAPQVVDSLSQRQNVCASLWVMGSHFEGGS